MKHSVKPEDVLPEDVNEKIINGIVARKGTIAALIGNIKKFEDPTTPEEVKTDIIEAIKDLIPAANAILGCLILRQLRILKYRTLLMSRYCYLVARRNNFIAN